MKSNYRRIGDFIELVDIRNRDLKVKKLLGLSISKQFIPSVANIVGTSMRGYKIIKKNQFACSIMQVRRDRKMPVALLKDFDEAIISQAYPVFEITKTDVLLPDYLMMWFTRSEFDRHAEFLAVGGVRGSLEWEDFLDMTLPVPSIEKQQEIVDDYNTVQDRIRINEQLNTALEETAQALYKHWFVDFEFPFDVAQGKPTNVSFTSVVSSSAVENDSCNENSKPVSTALDMTSSKPYKSSGGAMVYNEELDQEIPVGWEVVELVNLLKAKGYIRGPFGSALRKGDMKLEGFPIYEQQHVIHKHRNFRYYVDPDKFQSLQRFKVRPKDILISCSGTLGEIDEIKSGDSIGLINQALLIMRLDNSLYRTKFLKYFLISPIGRNRLLENAAGSAQVNMAKSQVIKSISMLLPNLQLLKEFEERIEHIENSINVNKKEILDFENLTAILLSKMATVVDGKELVN